MRAANWPACRRRLLLVAPGQKISTASPAAEQFLGQSQRRLLGRSLGEVLTLVDERLTERFSETDAPINARQIDAVVAGRASAASTWPARR
jgi:two-component system nitrogen regulation sensor histidine kinase GlnL